MERCKTYYVALWSTLILVLLLRMLAKVSDIEALQGWWEGGRGGAPSKQRPPPLL